MTGGESGRSAPPAPCRPLRGRGRHEDEPELEGAAGQAARHAAAEPKPLSPSQECHASCTRRGVSKNQLDTASRFQRWLPAPGGTIVYEGSYAGHLFNRGNIKV